MRSPPNWSRTASSCSPTPPTSSTARSRTSAPPCSAAASTGSSWRSATRLGKAVEKSTEDWRASAKIRQLWQHDKSVWTGDDENKWLGWLTSPAAADIADYEDFAHRVKGQHFTDAVVLGMGGSSLGPEVLAQTFDKQPGFPKLHVLDSTDPAQVRAMQASINLADTLFIVSSKSGSTTEPNVMKDYFFERVSETIGADKAGHRFIAVTDPGSSLEKVAAKQGFARIFYGDPAIGGRYSVLSPFGLVPAAAAGIDLRTPARRIRWRWCAPAGRTCRRMKIRACSLASPWALPASKAATRSPSCRRRRSPISAPGPSS